MNKTDRLLAIVLELQRNGMQRAEDLAAKFETSIRTIYRDMQALSEAGVPIVGAPGQGYSLLEGYFLPPMSFTVEEAVTLLIGLHFVEREFDDDYQAKAYAARGKIEAILPGTTRREAERVRDAFRLLTGKMSEGNGRREEMLKLLRRAILDQRRVRFNYKKPGLDVRVRKVDPYGIVYIGGTWVLVAFCHLRQALRHFRMSRIRDLELLVEGFRRPPDFTLHSYRPPDDRSVLIKLLIHHRAADKVKESDYFYIEELEDGQDGLHVTLRVRRPEEVLHWILGWGSDVVVLSPESLRQRVREEAEKIIKRY